ncbi:MAG: type VI secretion system contractile sheath large subunit [Nannocystaceae bacterium]
MSAHEHETPEDDHAHVRWLIVGPLTSKPQRTPQHISRDNFAGVLAAAAPMVQVDLADDIGASSPCVVRARFERIRSFSFKDCISSSPTLTTLRDLGEAFAGPISKRPEWPAALAVIADAVGEGPLYREVQACIGPDAAPSTEHKRDQQGANNGPAPDPPAIGCGGEVRQPDPSRRAVDAFVSTMRRGSTRSTASNARSAEHRKVRDIIESRVFRAVSRLLEDAEVRRVEALWRGIKLLVDHCEPGRISVQVVDVATVDVPAYLETRESHREDPMDGPDAVFLLGHADDTALLTKLAEAAAGLNAPVIVPVGPAFFRCDSAHAVATAIDDDHVDAHLPTEWSRVRATTSSRWLTTVYNRVVTHSEGSGDARRVVFSAPTLAFAAMLSSSFCHTGGFARILGHTGGLALPSTWEPPDTRAQHLSVPTEAFLPVRAQTKLGAAGIVGLGSARNSNTVLAANMPTVSDATDALPLAAQILTGRLVRFTQFVIDQIPAGCSASDLTTLFADAAKVFLFPGLPENAAHLEAQAVEEGRAVRLIATVRPEFAGIPFEVGFDMPLPVPVESP